MIDRAVRGRRINMPGTVQPQRLMFRCELRPNMRCRFAFFAHVNSSGCICLVARLQEHTWKSCHPIQPRMASASTYFNCNVRSPTKLSVGERSSDYCNKRSGGDIELARKLLPRCFRCTTYLGHYINVYPALPTSSSHLGGGGALASFSLSSKYSSERTHIVDPESERQRTRSALS